MKKKCRRETPVELVDMLVELVDMLVELVDDALAVRSRSGQSPF
ncbi:hypothetical protein V6259_13680 [Marinomonas sp. TI.3.20]